MKILLIGHEGYLGSRLQIFLQERGHVVAGFGRVDNIATITRERLERLKVELVINCATVANRLDRIYILGSGDEEVNLFGTRRLVEALKGTETGLVHISTKDVYGEVYRADQVQEMAKRLVPSFAIDERQPFRPETVYAKTKLMGEFVAEAHPKTTIVRLSSGYTSHLHPRGNWILHFCRASKRTNPVRINGSGKQLRDPLHVDDLGELLLLIQERSAWGLKLNAGGGLESAYSILEVLEMVAPDVPREFREGGDLGYVTDNGLAERRVGWRPTRSFEREIAALMERVTHE